MSWVIPEDLVVTDADGNPVLDADGNVIYLYNGGQICVEIADPYGCGTTEHCVFLYIGAAPEITPTIDEELQEFFGDVLLMCPEIPYVFDLNDYQSGPPYEDFTWWTNCGGENIYFPEGESVTLTSWQFPDDCWGNVITLNGLTENPCGSATMVQDVLIDHCEIEIPNVFTPSDGNDLNVKFEITGLDNYDDVLLRIFDRWGNLVYEDYDYSNDDAWYGYGFADGTYWYTLLLPNGFEHQGTVNIFRDLD